MFEPTSILKYGFLTTVPNLLIATERCNAHHFKGLQQPNPMVRFISNDTEGTGRKTRPVSEAIIQTYDNLPVIFGRLPTELVPTRFKVSLQPVLPSILSFSDSNIRRCSLDLGAAILFTGRRGTNNVCSATTV